LYSEKYYRCKLSLSSLVKELDITAGHTDLDTTRSSSTRSFQSCFTPFYRGKAQLAYFISSAAPSSQKCADFQSIGNAKIEKYSMQEYILPWGSGQANYLFLWKSLPFANPPYSTHFTSKR